MIAIDVGGTFTDIIAIDEKGNITAVKVPTDVKAMENSVIEGARRVGIKNHDMLNHASTCGLNAILTRNFPKVAFLTTEGHRDILDFARAWLPDHLPGGESTAIDIEIPALEKTAIQIGRHLQNFLNMLRELVHTIGHLGAGW